MIVTWSEVQSRRLKELNANGSQQNKRFDSVSDRDRAFQKLEKGLVKRERRRLKDYRDIHLRPKLCKLERKLVEVLVNQRFAQVVTPIIMSKGLLSKMSIGEDHPLTSQIYWIDKNK